MPKWYNTSSLLTTVLRRVCIKGVLPSLVQYCSFSFLPNSILNARVPCRRVPQISAWIALLISRHERIQGWWQFGRLEETTKLAPSPSSNSMQNPNSDAGEVEGRMYAWSRLPEIWWDPNMADAALTIALQWHQIVPLVLVLTQHLSISPLNLYVFGKSRISTMCSWNSRFPQIGGDSMSKNCGIYGEQSHSFDGWQKDCKQAVPLQLWPIACMGCCKIYSIMLKDDKVIYK